MSDDTRPWVKVATDLPDNKKLMRLGDHATLGLALHTAAICYCGEHLTDGFVPAGVAMKLVSVEGITVGDSPVRLRDLVAMLVHEELWHPADGGYQVHDYLKHNRSRAEAMAVKESYVERGKKGAKARWDGTSHGNSHSSSHGNSYGWAMPRVQSKKEPSENDGSNARTIHDRIAKEYGTIPTPKQTERLRILADRYGDEALKRVEYGIRRAAEANKPNTGYALTIAEGASQQELGGKSDELDYDKIMGGVTLA